MHFTLQSYLLFEHSDSFLLFLQPIYMPILIFSEAFGYSYVMWKKLCLVFLHQIKHQLVA